MFKIYKSYLQQKVIADFIIVNIKLIVNKTDFFPTM